MGKEGIEEKGKVLTCYHCGNNTFMERVRDFEKTIYDPLDEFGEYHTRYWQKWDLYFCLSCHNITLEKSQTFSEEIDISGKPIISRKIIYPQVTRRHKAIPEGVSDAFEAALKVRYIDGAICALSLRRTLEKICKDKGATKRNLYEKLRELSERNILPPILDNMAHVLKELGNAAAHADDIEFSEDLVESMVDFTQTILDYVYILPHRINEVQNNIGGKSNGSTPVSS